MLPGHEPTREGQAQEHCSPGPQVARRAEPAQAAQVGALRTAAQSTGSLTGWRLPPPPGQQREQQGHSRRLGAEEEVPSPELTRSASSPAFSALWNRGHT